MKNKSGWSIALAALASALLGSGAGAAAAADYPERPIQFVVPFAAGGGLDLNARSFANALSRALGGTVAVTNRAGAAGSIGLQAVASAAPDGYTLAFTPAVSLSSQPHRVKSIAYGLDSYKYVCQVFDNIFAIAVPGKSRYASVQDIVSDARARPGELAYGTSGVGSIPHLGTSDIEAATGTTLSHVAYKGDGPMLQDLLGERLAFGAVLASSITGQLASGALRLVAVYSDKRHPSFPDVPTLTEAGVPVVQLSFGGLLAPAGTPAPVIATLEKGCREATDSAAYLEWAAGANQVVDYQDGATFEQKMRQDSKLKEATIRRLGLDK